jgi:hypothetical protein
MGVEARRPHRGASPAPDAAPVSVVVACARPVRERKPHSSPGTSITSPASASPAFAATAALVALAAAVTSRAECFTGPTRRHGRLVRPDGERRAPLRSSSAYLNRASVAASGCVR